MTMKYFITGGAGFIGSNFTNFLLENPKNVVTVYDSFLTGKKWHFRKNLTNPRLIIIQGDVSDTVKLQTSIQGHDIVYHFAANSDIAAAQKEPGVDFVNGTVLTFNVLEAMRKTDVKRIVFTSGSGVYGEVPPKPIPELYDKMIPISTYGASKLASETLISAYSFMFDLTGTVFRFANVVGPNQTHGVTHDFILRLVEDNTQLKIFGNGMQSKPYIHVSDVLSAFKHIESFQTSGYDMFNVGSDDHLTVDQIADLVCKSLDLSDVKYNYTGGDRGWKADVPIYRLDTTKVRSLGWKNEKNSETAVNDAAQSMLQDINNGLYNTN
ncbi:MAG: NAD-dependent epimerase/dehydratase family protein [Bacteroidetes bacterium]|nr:NAD-dependent epimerase/dehydratase family protein [Bacteroidota bacterium]